jgi:nucleotide-binding universal stress UspA family protein
MKKILIPVDFNPLATAALEYASQFAARSGATLIVVYSDTFEPPAEFTVGQAASLAASIAESRRRTVEELERYAHEHVPETMPLRTEVRDALPVAGILAAIAEHDPDLVVMGTHGRGGLSRLMYGSVTEAVLAATDVPVLTINRTDAAKPPRTVVCVAKQGTQSSASERASAVAELFGTSCRMGAGEEADADLLVIGEENRAITRHARVPVLHVPERKGR